MDAADAPLLGVWASIRGYFTPATLFLVVNLVIGTIALTSRSHQRRRSRRHPEYHDDGLHHHEPLHQQQHEYHHYFQDQPLYATTPAPAPAPLARTSSVLDRLRSLGLYRFRSGDFAPEYGAAADPRDAFPPAEEEAAAKQAHYARSRSEPAPAREEERATSRMKKSSSSTTARKARVARAPARVVEAVAEDGEAVDARAQEFIGGFSPERERQYQREYVPPALAPAPAPAPLARTSSILDRLRSIDLYGFLVPEHHAAAPTPARDGFAAPAGNKKESHAHAHAHAHHDRSRSEPAWEQQSKKEKKQGQEARMAKSSSQPRNRSLAEAAADESVDARAEAFIDSFRLDRERSEAEQLARHYQQDEYAPPPAPAPLSRAPSVLDRLRSFGLYGFRSGDLSVDHPAAEAEPAPAAADEKKPAHYGRSRSEPAREQGKKEKNHRPEGRMSKSVSQAAAPGIDEEADDGVDARADDFINKFRQQLHLQRLNSLLNY